ncbi:hypothetical protein [Alkalibacterium sp. MB6]|uniref:hypothetical protein n=1 Tax=Alkalibacterium sp. MB6 TaxID=2081965 RepID=UPI001379B611|nr:hypothetical protein [Alkalibacterium sp. MB6]
MSDVGLRMLGKDDGGKAKGVSVNNSGAVKVDKQTIVHKVRNATVGAGVRVGLYGLEENSVYNTVQVSVSQSVPNKCRLLAQHSDELGTDYGTTDNYERQQRAVTMRASKRSSRMSIFFTNDGTEPITINADIVITTELAKDNNIMHAQNGEFRQRGDALSGASYTRLFANDTHPVSTTHPMPVQVTNQVQNTLQVDEYGKVGTKITLGAEKDSNGQGVLRVIDASPHAYDSQKDSLNVVQRHDNWTLKLQGANTVETTRVAEIARYHVIKKIIVSASVSSSVIQWDLLDGTTSIAHGYAHGSQVIDINAKITEGKSVKLVLSTSDSSTIRGVVIGETLEV